MTDTAGRLDADAFDFLLDERFRGECPEVERAGAAWDALCDAHSFLQLAGDLLMVTAHRGEPLDKSLAPVQLLTAMASRLVTLAGLVERSGLR